LFEPKLLDLKPAGISTACYRGYQATFAVVQSRLVLDTLHLNLFNQGEDCDRQEGPIINGVRPTGPSDEDDLFNNHYSGLNYHLEYNGGLLLADGFIYDHYEHMGFQPASSRMAEVRQKIIDSRGKNTASRKPGYEAIRAFIERSFDRTYRM
jgi:hypothetical protein